MKKLISPKMIILYLIIIISTLIIFKDNNKDNITYISLGDGYAKGKDSYGINNYSYGDYLKDKLKKNNELKEYINLYTEDDMTINKLKNYIVNSNYNVSKKQKKSLKGYLQEADFLTLSIGINDLRYEFLKEEEIDLEKINNSLNYIEEEFNNLIKEIKRYYKKDIYVIGYPINNLESYYLSMSIRKYNNFLENNKEIIYISPNILLNSDYFLNPKSNFYSTKGHQVISNEIYKTYEKSLKNK